VWSVVCVPTVAEEDDRRLHRERDRLINERVQHVDRSKALCALQGIYHYESMRPDRMRALERARTANGCPLPQRLKAKVVRQLQRLEMVFEMIKTVEAERERSHRSRILRRRTMRRKFGISSNSSPSAPRFQRAGRRSVLSEVC
jgi:transposase